MLAQRCNNNSLKKKLLQKLIKLVYKIDIGIQRRAIINYM